MDESGQESLGICGDHTLLPRLQPDPACVLRTRCMLGKQVNPVLPVGSDLYAAYLLDKLDAAPRDTAHDLDAYLDQVNVPIVLKDSQAPDSSRIGGEGPIAKVEAEQVHIIFGVACDFDVTTETSGARHPMVIRSDPSSERATWNSYAASDLTMIESQAVQRE